MTLEKGGRIGEMQKMCAYVTGGNASLSSYCEGHESRRTCIPLVTLLTIVDLTTERNLDTSAYLLFRNISETLLIKCFVYYSFLCCIIFYFS